MLSVTIWDIYTYEDDNSFKSAQLCNGTQHFSLRRNYGLNWYKLNELGPCIKLGCTKESARSLPDSLIDTLSDNDQLMLGLFKYVPAGQVLVVKMRESQPEVYSAGSPAPHNCWRANHSLIGPNDHLVVTYQKSTRKPHWGVFIENLNGQARIVQLGPVDNRRFQRRLDQCRQNSALANHPYRTEIEQLKEIETALQHQGELGPEAQETLAQVSARIKDLLARSTRIGFASSHQSLTQSAQNYLGTLNSQLQIEDELKNQHPTA